MTRLAKECFKNLTSEDLWHLYMKHSPQMQGFEKAYLGLNAIGFKGELAKLIHRYVTEAKPKPD